MKLALQKITLLFLLLGPLAVASAFSQDLTGIWRGYFKTDQGDTYKLEIQLKQSSNSFKGVTYSYHTTEFYGKATATGSYNREGQSALIKEIKTVELRMSAYSVSCIMKYLLNYSQSGKEEFLEGVYTSMYEKDSYGGKRGEDCGGGVVHLRKVPTSDFYVEPTLRENFNKSPTKKADTTAVVKVPVKQPTTTVTKPPVKKPTTTVVKPPVKKTTTPNTNKPAVAKVNPPPVKKITAPPKVAPDTAKLEKPIISEVKVKIPSNSPAVLVNRKNEVMESLIVRDPKVTVKLYDNGEIDGDTISVYLDKKLILSKKLLTANPLTINLAMDDANPDHELVMVAENLGRIPPNTSLMIVESGEQRFDVRITSTEQKNAVVRFKYKKPD